MIPVFAAISQRIAASTLAALADVEVVPDVGQPFVAEFDAVDREVFDGAQVGDYEIRYLAAAGALTTGDGVTINGTRYQVAALPSRERGAEEIRIAALIEVA